MEYVRVKSLEYANVDPVSVQGSVSYSVLVINFKSIFQIFLVIFLES